MIKVFVLMKAISFESLQSFVSLEGGPLRLALDLCEEPACTRAKLLHVDCVGRPG
jgi:hypothetical protein